MGRKPEARLLYYLTESAHVLLNALSLLDTQTGATGSTKMLELSAQGVGYLSGTQNIGRCGPSSTFCVPDEHDLSILSSWFRLESNSS